MPRLFLILLIGVSSVRVNGQVERSPLFSALSTGEYYGEVYAARTPGPRLRFVFFAGEPIKLKLIIGNRGPTDEVIQFAGTAPEEMFKVDLWRDDVPVDPRVSFEDGKWRRAWDDVVPFDGRGPTTLNPLQEVEWRGALEPPVAPGFYRLRIVTHAEDQQRRAVVADVATYEFEVRPRMPEAEPEVLRREALRHSATHEPEALAMADAAIDRLLQIHPTSYEAFFLRGRVADARGDRQRAVASYERAAFILRNEQDALLMKFKGPRERAQMLALIDELRTGKR